MAEKDQQVHPTTQTNGTQTKHDEEANTEHSKESRPKKRTKCYIYIAAFVVFQAAIILLFSLTVLKFRTPKFRVLSATFEALDAPITNLSFNIRMIAEIGVKNTNFGHYRYENTTITFFYRDIEVGSAIVGKARAKARSTRKSNVVVDLNSSNLPNNSELGNYLNSGFLPLSSRSRLSGKVEIMKVMKKTKSSEMGCTMEIDLSARELRNLRCK